MSGDFPLNDAEVVTLRENLRTHVIAIRDVERGVVTALQAAMACTWVALRRWWRLKTGQ